jgi:hypothetical protein
MRTISKPEADVSVVESASGISLMLTAFAVVTYVMFGVATLAAEAVRSPFLAAPL